VGKVKPKSEENDSLMTVIEDYTSKPSAVVWRWIWYVVDGLEILAYVPEREGGE